MALLLILIGMPGCAGHHHAPDAHPHAESPPPHAEDEHSHDEGHHSHDSPPSVVPDAEKTIAQDKALEGPDKTSGIASVDLLAAIALGQEFEALKGQQLRVRELVIAPGGVVAVHEHNQRPGVAYIIEGEMTEHRSDQDAPIVHKAGSVAVEHTGVSHWWENKSDAPARALVIDILPDTP